MNTITFQGSIGVAAFFGFVFLVIHIQNLFECGERIILDLIRDEGVELEEPLIYRLIHDKTDLSREILESRLLRFCITGHLTLIDPKTDTLGQQHILRHYLQSLEEKGLIERYQRQPVYASEPFIVIRKTALDSIQRTRRVEL